MSGVVVFNSSDNNGTSAAVRFVFPRTVFSCAVMHWNSHIDVSVMMTRRIQACTHLNDSKATNCTGTLSYPAENPTLAKNVFNLEKKRFWLPRHAISSIDEGTIASYPNWDVMRRSTEPIYYEWSRQTSHAGVLLPPVLFSHIIRLCLVALWYGNFPCSLSPLKRLHWR